MSSPSQTKQESASAGRVKKLSGARALRSQSGSQSCGRKKELSINLMMDRSSSSDHAKDSCSHYMSIEDKDANKAKPRDEEKPYVCPFFCGQTFTKPCDLKRHLKRDEGYVCNIGRRWKDNQNRQRCTFCSIVEPNDEHFESEHRFDRPCREKELSFSGGLPGRFHSRSDKFKLHVKRFHPCVDEEGVERIYLKPPLSRSCLQCGFCGATFQSTDEFSDHVALQMKAGRALSEWRNPWDASVAPDKPCDRKRVLINRKNYDDYGDA
ncbi:MAG: hypothetical protein Q9157_003292 [Trypethelium eluteriae]